MIHKAFASSDGNIGNIKPPPSIISENTEIQEVMINIAESLLYLVGGAAALALVIAGIMWATAMGDDEKITQAKRLIKWSLIGLVLAFSAYGITALLVQMFAPDMTNI